MSRTRTGGASPCFVSWPTLVSSRASAPHNHMPRAAPHNHMPRAAPHNHMPRAAHSAPCSLCPTSCKPRAPATAYAPHPATLLQPMPHILQAQGTCYSLYPTFCKPRAPATAHVPHPASPGPLLQPMPSPCPTSCKPRSHSLL